MFSQSWPKRTRYPLPRQGGNSLFSRSPRFFVDSSVLFFSSLSPVCFFLSCIYLSCAAIAPVTLKLSLGCRSSPESRQAASQTILSRVSSAASWPQVLIYPEGLIGNGSCLLRFNKGSLAAATPVQPLAIKFYTSRGVLSFFSVSRGTVETE
jgi:hypothetical protein